MNTKRVACLESKVIRAQEESFLHILKPYSWDPQWMGLASMVRKASEPDLIGDIHRVVVKGAPKVDDVIRGRQLVTLLPG